MEPITSNAIQLALQQVLQPSFLEVHDDSAAHAGHAGSNGLGHGTHFRVRIQASVFNGLSRVAQHRLVYDALSDFMSNGLHALAIEVIPATSANTDANEIANTLEGSSL